MSELSLVDLPESILLSIFQYLPVKELCMCGRVCQRWRRIVRDNSLWRHVDLLPYQLNIQKMWKIIRSHFSECLLTMKLKGPLDHANPNSKKYSLTTAMLGEIRDRCPNIRELHLYFCNTDNISADDLPKKLRKLVMHRCTWKPRWLRGVNLECLNDLDLSCCTRIDSHDVQDVVQFTGLKSLVLDGCYRVRDQGTQLIGKNLTNLTRLSLRATQFEELSLHHFSRNLKELRQLSLENSNNLTDSGLDTLASGCKNMEVLSVIGCRQVTLDGLLRLTQFKNLKRLFCDKLDDLEMEKLHSVLKRVEISTERDLDPYY